MYDVFTHEPLSRQGGRDRRADAALVHVHAGAEAGVLASIHAPEVNLAIWQRRLAAQAACEAVKLVVAGGGDVRLCGAVAQLDDRLAGAMRDKGWPDVPCLRADVAALAARFAATMACPELALRLEIVTGDGCRKFHADYVTARLISSYTGPGSEWLDNAAAQALASGEALKPADVRRLAAGEVALFKGRLWSETPIIHRSPPIAGTGQRRLVLVINPATGED
jgi:hypothetical protein